MDFDTAFAATLRSHRNRMELTQEELGFRANVDRSYVSLLERKKFTPTLKLVFKICEALGITPSEFVSDLEKRLKGEI